MHAGERLEQLAPTQPGHSQIADDQIEWLHQRALQRLAPVARQYDLVSPAFECRLHVVEDVRLVINNEYPEAFLPLGWGRLALRTTRQRAERPADSSRQLHGEGRAPAATRAAGIHRDVAAVLLHDAQTNGEPEARAFPFGFGAEKGLEHALRDRFRDAGPVVGNVDREAVRLALGGDFDSPAACLGDRRARDRLRGVVDDVHEHLLDLIRVHLDLGQARLEGERQLDARREQLVLQELMRGLENGPDRLQLPLAFLAPRSPAGMAVTSSVRSPDRTSTGAAAPSGESNRATGSTHDGGKSVIQGRPGSAVTGSLISSANMRLARRTAPYGST